MKSAALSMFKHARALGLIPVTDYELEDFPRIRSRADMVKALADYCERSPQATYQATKEVDVCDVSFFTANGDPAGVALIVHGNDLDEEVADHTTGAQSEWMDEWWTEFHDANH